MSDCDVIHYAKLDPIVVSILKKEAVDKVVTPEFYDRCNKAAGRGLRGTHIRATGCGLHE